MNIDVFFLEEFNSACEKLIKQCGKYGNKIKTREEIHDTNYAIEKYLQIIVSKFINEDNYGLVLSMIVKKQKINNQNCIELCVLKGDGFIINSIDIHVNDEFVEDQDELRDSLKNHLNFLIDKFLFVLEDEYML